MFQVGEYDYEPYVVMLYIDGPTLGTLMHDASLRPHRSGTPRWSGVERPTGTGEGAKPGSSQRFVGGRSGLLACVALSGGRSERSRPQLRGAVWRELASTDLAAAESYPAPFE